jgi:hypothetical protein
MSHLKDLIEKFDNTSLSKHQVRTRLVLEMVAFTIRYPPSDLIDPAEIAAVDICVHTVIDEIEARKDHLFADRIGKIWKKRDYLLQLAYNAEHTSNNYMDVLEYHEEVKWIKDMIRKMSKKS